MKGTVAACVLALVIGASAAYAEEIFIPPPVKAGVDWNGWAVGKRRVFRQNANDEDVARARARIECERATGRTCGAIAVPDDGSWAVAVVYCGDAGSFVGGSSIGTAEDVALYKAEQAGFDRSDCVRIFAQ